MADCDPEIGPHVSIPLLTHVPVQTSLGPLASYDGPSHPEHARLVEPDNYAGIESGMVFLGMAALEDPPRPEVRDAIEECTLAGIRVGHPLR